MTATGIVSTGWRVLTTAAAALVIAGGVFGDRPSAQASADTAKGENFDIRNGATSSGGNSLARVAADASFSAALATARAAGVARLRADHDGIDLEYSPLTGASRSWAPGQEGFSPRREPTERPRCAIFCRSTQTRTACPRVRFRN